jgi:hypothetical protein
MEIQSPSPHVIEASGHCANPIPSTVGHHECGEKPAEGGLDQSSQAEEGVQDKEKQLT